MFDREYLKKEMEKLVDKKLIINNGDSIYSLNSDSLRL
ncbi:MAG: hypothetical protein C5S41_01910 [Candidatus Methanomarinus sp.]|nr:MAG: hypothetical protein C5S41_01910 [ANME-2 cluster archaeon]